MTTTETTDSREPAERFMRERMEARLMWEQPGPDNTMIDWLQCWMIPASNRLVMVQCFNRGGWECFPQVMANNLDVTEAAIRA